jgi:hypothetical protein
VKSLLTTAGMLWNYGAYSLGIASAETESMIALTVNAIKIYSYIFTKNNYKLMVKYNITIKTIFKYVFFD